MLVVSATYHDLVCALAATHIIGYIGHPQKTLTWSQIGKEDRAASHAAHARILKGFRNHTHLRIDIHLHTARSPEKDPPCWTGIGCPHVTHTYALFVASPVLRSLHQTVLPTLSGSVEAVYPRDQLQRLSTHERVHAIHETWSQLAFPQ